MLVEIEVVSIKDSNPKDVHTEMEWRCLCLCADVYVFFCIHVFLWTRENFVFDTKMFLKLIFSKLLIKNVNWIL